MRLVVAFLSAVLVSAHVAQAETCPPSKPDEDLRTDLMDRVRVAEDEATAAGLVNELWTIWADAPDAHAQELLDSGIERREIFDLDQAMDVFGELIAYCPDYAEGYNQRAFVLFIKQEHAAAIEDLNRALDRSPEHLGALTGRAMAYMSLDQNAEALADLERALALNPWLPERGLLPVLQHRLGVEEL